MVEVKIYRIKSGKFFDKIVGMWCYKKIIFNQSTYPLSSKKKKNDSYGKFVDFSLHEASRFVVLILIIPVYHIFRVLFVLVRVFLFLIICLTSLTNNNDHPFPSLTVLCSQHCSSPHQIRAVNSFCFQHSDTAPLLFNSATTRKPSQGTSTDTTSRISP